MFRLGRLLGPRGPGLVWIVPGLDRTRSVNLQIDTADIKPQDVITKDNVTVHIEAAVFYRVVDPEKSVVQIRDYEEAILRTRLRGRRPRSRGTSTSSAACAGVVRGRRATATFLRSTLAPPSSARTTGIGNGTKD